MNGSAMSDNTYAEALGRPGQRQRYAASTPQSAELAGDALWVIFLLGASSAFSFLRVFGIMGTERFVWFPADLFALVFLCLRQKEALLLIRQNAVFVSWALLACVSFVWSDAPFTSLYHGIQLFFTILVGLILVNHTDLVGVQRLVFIAALAAAIGSIVFVAAVPQYAYSLAGGWLGVFAHKNVMGAMMLVLFLTGAVLFFSGWRPVLSLVGMCIGAALLVFSKSAASLVMAGATLPVLALAVGYRRGPIQFALCIGVGIALATMVLMILEAADQNVMGVVLGQLGKDETLTGRTVIWDIAMDAYEQRPWLGYGFKGFWEGGGPGAEYLRNFTGYDFWHFHNNFIEVLVAFGFFGPVLFVGSIIFGFYRTLRAFAVEPVMPRIWPVLMLVIIVVACFAEVPLFVNHSFYQLLFIISVASVLQRSGVHQ